MQSQQFIDEDESLVLIRSAEPSICYDGLLILEAPDDETATTLLLHLGTMGNVQTTTARAFSAAEMDKILAKIKGG